MRAGVFLVCGLAFLIPPLVALFLLLVGICACLYLVWRDSKRRQLSYCVTFLDWAKAPLRFMRRVPGLAPPTRPESRAPADSHHVALPESAVEAPAAAPSSDNERSRVAK